ncbi:MAG: sugar-binding domain-containing protein [Pirellulaceae bacterium]
MHDRHLAQSVCLMTFLSCAALAAAELSRPAIPLPEHPRPDFQRPTWLNLNGPWQFQFDPQNQGLQDQWFTDAKPFPQTISVPFPWGSPLSGVEDRADIGWYARSITVPASWQGQRVFLVVGASDWHTTAWLDGHLLGEHQGGYTPFSLDLTPYIQFDVPQRLVLQVDDTPHPFKLEGKQGYGRASGIWQTVYLERRPAVALDTVHFTPDVDGRQVVVDVSLDRAAPQDMTLQIRFQPQDQSIAPCQVASPCTANSSAGIHSTPR